MPAGYFAFESSTYNVFLFFRTVMTQGDDGPDPAPAVANAELTRIYPLRAQEKDIPPMEFPNASDQHLDMMYPVDNAYWTKLKDFVDYEPVQAIDLELRGVLASIGIVKGEPFEPTGRQQELLQKAVETAPRMILANRQLGRPDKRHLYYEDRQWERAWVAGTAEWMQQTFLDIDARAAFFQYAYSSAPAMVMRTIGAGSKYPYAIRDADGDFLDGGQSYRLHVPANPPAGLFWAFTAYNPVDGTFVETEQMLPSINGYNKIETEADGSFDIWFGPELPAAAPESNFIQTNAGRPFLVAFRLYGAEVAFYDQTWKLDDIVKVD